MIGCVLPRLGLALILISLPVAASAQGVVVISVAPGYSGADAGIEVGDVLTHFAPEDGAAPEVITTPLQFAELASDPGQRGTVTFSGHREGEEKHWQVEPGFWFISVRPRLDSAALASYESAIQALGEGDLARIDELQALSVQLAADGHQDQATWVAVKLASTLRGVDGQYEDANNRSRQLASDLLDQGELAIAAQILEYAGRENGRGGRMKQAVALLNEGLQLRIQAGDTPIQEASDLRNLGIGYSALGQLDQAQEVALRAIEILKREVPGSLDMAEALHTLGNAQFWSGDLDAAEKSYLAMIEIRRRLAPDSVYLARSLAVLGNVYWRRGDLDRAQALYEESHHLYVSTGAQPEFLAQNLMSQGFIAHDRRDLALADNYYRQALTILKKHDPEGDAEASAYLALGNTARVRHDLVAADALYMQAQRLFRGISEESQRLPMIKLSRAQIARTRGELDLAQQLLDENLTLLNRINPDGVLVPNTYLAMSAVASQRGELTRAEALGQEALARYRKVREGGILEGQALHGLARVSLTAGEYTLALERATSALQMLKDELPMSIQLALAAHAKALAHWRLDQRTPAREAFELAVDTLDAQRGRLGGDAESASAFSVAYSHIYNDFAAFMLQGDDVTGALSVIARKRQVQIARLLGEAGIVARDALGADARRRLSQLDYQYQEAYEDLTEGQSDDAEHQALLTRMATLRSERSELLSASDSVIQAADNIEMAGKQAMLTWVLRDQGSFVFVVTAKETVARPIDLNPSQLQADVQRFRTLLQVVGAGEVSRAPMRELAAALHHQLIAPVADALASAEHLILMPDGPLWRLPFAALIDSTAGQGERFLIERFTLSVSPLMVAMPERATPLERLLAFANPEAPEGDATENWRANRRSRGALPFAAMEASAIAGRFQDAEVLIGEQASESRLKQATQADVLHLATHGVLDSGRAMDSYLMLSPESGDENGLLHAWEVHEQLDLTPTTLVTLSACDTAPGAGDGLLGLNWAFHAAGAEYVLATLWPVEDRSTSELMQATYRAMDGAVGPAQALRRAQMAAINSDSRQSHPFYWAGFQISALPHHP